MKLKLPILKFNKQALEPYISRATIDVHYNKHHKKYAENFHNDIKGIEVLNKMTAEEVMRSLNSVVPEDIRENVKNNGGGFVNHNLYWKILGPKHNIPKGEVLVIIERSFGSYDNFVKLFNSKAMTIFGSGWVFLVLDNDELKIVIKKNQETPLSDGCDPLIAIDLWEHAYYLDYKNDRAAYMLSVWNILDWESINDIYRSILQKRK